MRQAELFKKWQGNKRYTLKFIDLIEEHQLSFRPTDGTKTYQSQLSHITTWLRTQSRHLTGESMPKPATKTKADIRQSLEEFFDVLLHYLTSASDEDLSNVVDLWFGKVTKESLLLTMDNHLSHHRGQLVVYLRMMDLKPPSYIGW